MDYKEVKSKVIVEKTIESLKAHGIDALYVETGEEAKQKVLELIPEGAEVMTMTSVTLDTIGVSDELNESGKYDSVKTKLYSMDGATQGNEMKKLGAAPEYAVGSVHAITENGKVFIASGTGSQLPAYVYGSQKVIWVVGTNKIVKDSDDAMKRIYEYTLPLESERARKAYGVPGSSVNKLLVVNNEAPGRITVVFVNESLGY